MPYFQFIKPLLYRLEPEKAHHLALWALHHGLVPAQPAHDLPSLATSLWGIDFPSPIGLAAGFDKNAAAIDNLLTQGFGFIEAGTVTPLPQAGNPRPRLFRLEEDLAIINRMGFNNDGIEPFALHMSAQRSGIVGSNIGKNKDSTDPIADYITLLQALYPLSDYITINISSPNTPGLRALQGRQVLGELLAAIRTTRSSLAATHSKPILIKIAPDLCEREMEDIVEVALDHQMDGLIVSNTTIQLREKLRSSKRLEAGGLSGKPLKSLADEALLQLSRITKGTLPLIGVGGIFSGDDAYAKIRAGASLVQLYSVLIYQGFDAVTKIKARLAELLERDGFASVAEAVGVDVSS